jgi:ERCC4-related helicase
MTAQTMQNDLSKGVLNAQDVIMLVIGEWPSVVSCNTQLAVLNEYAFQCLSSR